MNPGTSDAAKLASRGQKSFLSGGGAMDETIASMDWSTSPLGPVELWPQSLRTTVSLCLASNFPISIVWGRECTQIYNDGYWPICGGKHPRSMGQDFRECWHSAWPVVGDAFERAQAGQTSYLENARMFLDRNGYLEETFFTFSFSPIRDENGDIAGLFHPVTETTAQMLSGRRTRALRDLAGITTKAKSAEEACQLAAAVLADYTLDLPFVLLYLCDEGEREVRLAGSSGLKPDSSAMPAHVVFDGPEGEMVTGWPFLQAVKSLQPVLVNDLPGRFGELSAGPYPEPLQSALVLPIPRHGSDRLAGLVVAGTSTRKALDDSYRGFYDLLAGHVATALANARAYEAERRRAEALAEIDRVKTAFFSNVSHEFRTPLTLLLGPLEEVLDHDESIPDHARSQIQLAHRNGLRLQKLVNSLLDFSRIEAGRAQAVYERVDLAGLTAELASNFRSAFEKAGLRLIVDCQALTKSIYVDREMWEKITLNLLSNAFKFTFDGSVTVLLREVDHGAELSVADTGAGIPSNELEHLFERFHRVEGARGRTFEGSGIGLALVYELVKLHSGSVRVESELERGSTFTVFVPAGTGHLPKDRIGGARDLSSTALRSEVYLEEALRWLPDAAQAGMRQQTAYPQPPLAGVGGENTRSRVLVADDNSDMRNYLNRLLSPRYEVMVVSNGEEAIEAVPEFQPDLVLTDVMMPRMDGFELLSRLRGDRRTRIVPIILLSARAGEEARVEGLDAGADDYLIKPFTGRELLARVNSHIEMARVRKDALEAVRRSEGELKQRGLQLSQRVAEFETLFREVPLGVAVARDARCETIRINPAFARLLGVPEGENASKTRADGKPLPFRIIRDRCEVPAEDLPMQRAAREGREIHDFEFEVVRADGTAVFLFGHAVPLTGVDGKPAGAIGVFLDFTERMRGQREREALIRELERSNGDLSRFSFAVSHDLQAPVNHVRCLTQLLYERGAGQTEEEREEVFRMIERATGGMQRLIRSLLRYAQIGEGHIEKRPVPLNTVVDTVKATLSSTIAKTRTRLSWGELPVIPADLVQMEELFQNLISNAIQYRRPEAAPVVEISARAIGEAWEFAVRDNGQGIPPEHHARVFEPLTRLNAGTEHGTGLGLSLCQTIVTRHGGRLWVESEGAGLGASFHFTLPRE